MVKSVNIKKAHANQQVVSLLESMLESAKSGELQSIMVVERYAGELYSMGWAGEPCLAMIGKLEELRFEFFSKED